MADMVETSNVPAERRNEVAKTMAEIELYPAVVEKTLNVAQYSKFPISRLATFGTAFEPVTAAFQYVISGGKSGGSGLYRVTVPQGGHLATARDGSGFLGGALKTNNQVGAGQSRLHPLACDPTMLFMAMALANIDKKLDTIQEMQQELMNFLVQKERSELKGDIKFLADTLANYKHNWNNEKFKNSSHVKVLDIRQAADRKIDFYREQIASKISKKSFFHSDQDVKKQLGEIESEFSDYQLAVYLFAFSSFLEVMLLENFSAAYLDCITKKIEEHSLQYRELYSKCYDQLEDYSKTSIQSQLLKGLASVNKVAGEAIAKVPVISKSQIDENLIKAGDKLGEFNSKRTGQTLKQFIEKQSAYVRPFVDNINTVNRLYNQTTELLFDQENFYFGATEA
jgi:hypothetical protein